MRASAKRRDSSSEPILARLSDELWAIPASQVLALSLSVPHAVATILQSVPRVRQLKARMRAELPAFDINLLDKLPDYAIALSQAHAACQTVADGGPRTNDLFKQAKNLRKQLLADVVSLAGYGLIDSAVLRNRSHANSHANVAQDLSLLATALQRAWPKIQGRTPHTPDDLAATFALATRLLDPSPREQAETECAQTRDLRARVFTLAQRAYRELRRAAAYLREPEGDADAFAPSAPRTAAMTPEVHTTLGVCRNLHGDWGSGGVHAASRGRK